jgi:hypothetical protein
MVTYFRVPGCYLGLDLGQPSDRSSLAVVERAVVAEQKHFRVRHLERWPPGTAYPVIRDAVCKRVGKALVHGGTLVIDQTAVGKGIVDIFGPLKTHMNLKSIIITAGRMPRHHNGVHFVPKIELAATLPKLLQTGRIKFAKLPETSELVKELMDFKTKIPVSASDDTASWRERPHDDLCFAVMIAVWLGELEGLQWFMPPSIVSPGINTCNPHRW